MTKEKNNEIKRPAFGIRVIDLMLDLIYPIECVNCGIEGKWLCDECYKKLEFNQQSCLHCKKTNTFGEFCPGCKDKYSLNGVWIAGDYKNEIISQLIKNLKYRFTNDAAKSLAIFVTSFIKNLKNIGDLKEACPEILRNLQNTLLIPVPLHKKRFKWRGFNQAELIADFITSNCKATINKDLIRTKHKKPQAKLDKEKRQQNIINCYAWKGASLKGKNIVLLDDVVTTGSTLNECAKVLKLAGAKEVWGLVVASN